MNILYMCKGEKWRFHGNWPRGHGRCMFVPFSSCQCWQITTWRWSQLLPVLCFRFLSVCMCPTFFCPLPSLLSLLPHHSNSDFFPELSCHSVVETDRGKWTVEECLHRKKGVFWSVISDGPTAGQTVANYTYYYNKTLKQSTCTSILRIDCEHNIIISSLISDATIRGWKRYQTSLRIQDAILAFPYIVHIVSTIHSPMCLTSALHISLLLPRHNNQWFIWSWLNCFLPPLRYQERVGWVAILSVAHPVNLSCQSGSFTAGRVQCSTRRVLPWRKSPPN